MKLFARIASAVIASSIALAPLSAMAGENRSESAKHHDDKGQKAPSKHDQPAFPMKADDFRKMVDKRIERIETRAQRAMRKHNVPEAQRGEANKAIETAVKSIHATVDKVAADGVVTRDEAKQVKEIADFLREKLREQWKDMGPKAKPGTATPKGA